MSASLVLRTAGLSAIALAAAVMVGCGGGGGGSSTPSATATPTSAATATATPTSGATSSPVPTASPTTVATTLPLTSTVSFPEVPAATGFGLALQFGSSPSPSGEIVNVVAYNYAAPNVPAPGATASPVPTGGATAKVLATWTFQLPSTAAAVTVPSPTEVFVGLPGPPPTGTNYYSYFADITAKASNGGYTPLTYANGGSASSAASGNGTTLTPGDVYALELVNF